MFVWILRESQCAMTALFIMLLTTTGTAVVCAQSPCSISAVGFYPQTAIAGQTVNITSQVTFICGPSYENVWKVRVDISNTEYNIASTNSTQYVYASYAHTQTNVTNIFMAPQKKGDLNLLVNVYVIAQSSGKVYASTSSALTVQVQPGAVTNTTTTSTRASSTTTQTSATSTLTTYSITESGFPLSTDQIYILFAVLLSVLFIVVVVVRLKRTIRGRAQDSTGTIDPSAV